MADQGLIGNTTRVAGATGGVGVAPLMKNSLLYTNNNAVHGGNASRVAGATGAVGVAPLMKNSLLYTNNNVGHPGRKASYDQTAGFSRNNNPTSYRGPGVNDGATTIPNKTISGIVTENGVPLANCLIHLHYRPAGTCIGRTWSAADGTYSFTGLVADTNYFIVFQDKAGGTVYNDIIQSQFIPG